MIHSDLLFQIPLFESWNFQTFKFHLSSPIQGDRQQSYPEDIHCRMSLQGYPSLDINENIYTCMDDWRLISKNHEYPCWYPWSFVSPRFTMNSRTRVVCLGDNLSKISCKTATPNWRNDRELRIMSDKDSVPSILSLSFIAWKGDWKERLLLYASARPLWSDIQSSEMTILKLDRISLWHTLFRSRYAFLSRSLYCVYECCEEYVLYELISEFSLFLPSRYTLFLHLRKLLDKNLQKSTFFFEREKWVKSVIARISERK